MLTSRTIATLSLGLAVNLVSLNILCAQTTQPVIEPTAAAADAPVWPAAPAPAAPGAAAAAAEDVPNAPYSFVGTVNGSGVNVRSGPAESYYPTSQLNKGDRVVVVGIKFDWLKIVPPKGSFSYVSKKFVRQDPGSSVGIITATNVRVIAGSSMNQLKVQEQMKLNTDDKVTIIGDAEEYFKISPPEGAYLYVAKKFVEPVRQATTRETEAPVAPLAGRPSTAIPAIRPLTGNETGGTAAAPQGESTELIPAVPAVPGHQAAAPATGKASEELVKLNADLEAVQKQPISERPLGELRQSYEALAAREDASLSVRRAAEHRVAVLRLLEKQQTEVVDARKDASQFRAKQAEYENQRRQIETRIKQVGVVVYTAVGQLDTSSIQPGGQPLYRLVDPADGQTVVYIRTSDATQTAMIGKYVGVRGEVVSDQQLAVKVISPMSMEPVDSARVMRPGGSTALYYPASAMKGRSTDVQGTTQPAAPAN